MGFEPTVSDVTGRRFNQLSYIFLLLFLKNQKCQKPIYPN